MYVCEYAYVHVFVCMSKPLPGTPLGDFTCPPLVAQSLGVHVDVTEIEPLGFYYALPMSPFCPVRITVKYLGQEKLLGSVALGKGTLLSILLAAPLGRAGALEASYRMERQRSWLGQRGTCQCILASKVNTAHPRHTTCF